ncbi:MAG TPA: HAMP domain-containing sensor histidine kinase [Gemmatimonadales bacterium]|nr:HAMP domain-containing sensor histidine kinase [Gemmatimonadales bacterium]
MNLSFRQRIYLVLIVLGAVPTAAAILGWALTQRASAPAAGGRAALEAVAASGRELLLTLDTSRLTPAERGALAAHVAELNSALSRTSQADAYTRYYSTGLAAVILFLGALLVYASLRLGGHLSRQLSRPIDELIGWTGHIRRHEPLPPDRPRRGAPEFAALRTALREMAAALERGRARELEAERLRAFREVARRVAHEMKNPLTPMRFAVAQLARSATNGQREALEVLAAETDRLEQLAREFTELGRLPSGPPAEVDLAELLGELLRTALPPEIERSLDVAPGTPPVVGHYDPIRRAFANILRNAVEAMHGRGAVRVAIRGEPGCVVVEVSDTGPGVPPADRERIFDPYVTGKRDGTGLGLALVKQTVETHGGSVAVMDAPGGGARFVVRLSLAGPRQPEGEAAER